MSTRRGFLGLLAAAPIAAPAVVKEALAAPLHSGGNLRGLSAMDASIGELRIDVIKPDPDSIARLRQLMRAPTPWAELPPGCSCHPDDKPPVPCPRLHAFSDCIATVPNRLYGATINHEGDAV